MVDQIELSQRAPWSVSVRPRTVFRAYDTGETPLGINARHAQLNIDIFRFFYVTVDRG